MHAFKTFVAVSTLVLGASAYVLNPVHSLERDVVVHRRHAHALGQGAAPINARSPVANANVSSPPVFSRAERRAIRQKRCIAQNPGNSNPTPDTPVNTTPDHGQDDEQDQGDDQGQGEQPVDNNPPQGGQPGNSNPPPTNNGGDTFTGEITYYDVGLGACGGWNGNGDMIAAASKLLYDGFEGYWGGNPNNNPICGRDAVVTYQGKTITVKIVDRCEGCAVHDLDLSPTAFGMLAPHGDGRLRGATWHWA